MTILALAACAEIMSASEGPVENEDPPSSFMKVTNAILSQQRATKVGDQSWWVENLKQDLTPRRQDDSVAGIRLLSLVILFRVRKTNRMVHRNLDSASVE